MPAVVTFDGPSREIREINTGLDSNELDQVEVYSEWKEWAKANPAFAPAFRYAGADPISDVQNTGTTFFLLNGWRYVPADYKHQLIITGNLFTDPAGRSRTKFDDITAQGIEVVYTVSNLVDSSIARLDLAQLQEAIFIDTINGTTAALGADGTPTNPFNNEADAVTAATASKLRSFSIIGSITLTQGYSDWKFIGTVSREAGHINLGGQSLIRCKFQELTIDGSAGGSTLFVDNCVVEMLTGALGVFRQTAVNSLISAGASGLLTLRDCYSDVPGLAKPVLDLADNLSDNAQVRGWHGGLELRNVDVPGQTISLDIDSGDVLIDSTCIEGTVVIRGPISFTNNGGPNLVVVDKTTPRVVWDTVVP